MLKFFKPQEHPLYVGLILIMIGASQLQGMLALYLTKVLHMPDNHAYHLYAAYGAIIYTVSIIGGFVGGRYMSHERLILVGLYSSALSLFLCSFSSVFLLECGLSFFILAAGIVVPNAFAVFGSLYPPQDPQRHTKFTLGYTSMNMGALLGFIPAGFLLGHFGFLTTFRIGAMIIFLGTLLSHVGYRKISTPVKNFQPYKAAAWLIGCLIISYVLLQDARLCNQLMVWAGVITIIIVAIAAIRNPPQRKNLFVLLFLIALGLLFWSCYLLQPTLITLFVDRNMSHELFHHVIPTTTLMGLNAFYMIFLGPLFALLWWKLHHHQIHIATHQRFFIGIVMLGLAFLSLYTGIVFATPAGQSSVLAIIVFFFFLSVGEMILAPAGYAAIGELVGEKYHSVMLGAWQIIIGVSASLSGYIAQSQSSAIKLPIDTNPMYSEKFLLVAGLLIGVGIICLTGKFFLRRHKKTTVADSL